jgi:putative component of membrane protein insertase Oxa1/YidC/SpoIIIJ protein YidD
MFAVTPNSVLHERETRWTQSMSRNHTLPLRLGPSLAIAAIAFYQSWISPIKGFRCAHRAHRGGLSCSEFGKQIIRSHGVSMGISQTLSHVLGQTP